MRPQKEHCFSPPFPFSSPVQYVLFMLGLLSVVDEGLRLKQHSLIHTQAAQPLDEERNVVARQEAAGPRARVKLARRRHVLGAIRPRGKVLGAVLLDLAVLNVLGQLAEFDAGFCCFLENGRRTKEKETRR